MISKSLTAASKTLFSTGARASLKTNFEALSQLHSVQESGLSMFYQSKRSFCTTGHTEEHDTQTHGKQNSKSQKEETPKSASARLVQLLNEKPEGYEKEIRQLFEKQSLELNLKSKTAEDLTQKLEVEEKKATEWHKKTEALRKSVKDAEEDSALTRKRYEKMMEDTKVFSISKFAKDLLEIPDNFERAIQAVQDPALKESELFEGVVATHSLLLKALERHGVTQLNPHKEKFDPHRHEALFDYDDPTAEPGTCGVVALTGYMIQERVLRPAKVGVVKKRA
mmetsp:Transcript_53566/g.61462  ORF Transcript_53566/g.61462 Transcript_53566/m.61462 type:complete len:281 (+) Transcript_53566:61-903(+)